ncbi:MAG TPA: hypothetical protein VII82_06080 [Polyangiaceae bacterium]|jgi:hypothetical protein
MTTVIGPNALAIFARGGIGGPQASADSSVDDPGTTLTPDSLMAYCQSRLDSIGSQVQSSFDQQNKNASEISQIQDVANTFKSYSTANQSGANLADMQTRLGNLVNQIQGTDPNSAALPGLKDTLAQLNSSAGDNLVVTTEIEGFAQNITDSANDLNSGSELQMVQLQSLMSQRQTAISLTTNLVQSLGDQENKIADNIGK